MIRTRNALDIIEGRKDEDGWLPAGVVRRPEAAMNVPPGSAPRLAQPLAKGGALDGKAEQSVRDYIGARAADGDSPADIMAGLLDEGTLQRAGDRSAFMEALNKVAPLYGADGKMVRAESHAAAFEKMADDYVARTHGEKLQPIHKQQFPVDQVAVTALHEALAKHPDGVAAFKPIGDLTPQEQAALRRVFTEEYGRTDPAGRRHARSAAESSMRPSRRKRRRACSAARRTLSTPTGAGSGTRPPPSLTAQRWTGASICPSWDRRQTPTRPCRDVVRSKVLKEFCRLA